MPTMQETFDTVVSHLRKQGGRCETRDGCLYYGPDGKHCAAGCLIPPEKYRKSIEYTSIQTEDGSLTPAGQVISDLGHDTKLVYALQRVHDDKSVTQWEECFADVASRFGLTYSPPDGGPGASP